ncbi:hypothetical protein RFI_30285, partial [Reticulomyxa filosa]
LACITKIQNNRRESFLEIICFGYDHYIPQKNNKERPHKGVHCLWALLSTRDELKRQTTLDEINLTRFKKKERARAELVSLFFWDDIYDKKKKIIIMIFTATEELTIWRIYNLDAIGVRGSVSLVEILINNVNNKYTSPSFFLVCARDCPCDYIAQNNDRFVGGMQHGAGQGKYPTELRALIRLCGDVMEEEELKRQLEENNGNIFMIIEKIVSTLITQKVSLHSVQTKIDKYLKADNANAENKTQELENESKQITVLHSMNDDIKNNLIEITHQ